MLLIIYRFYKIERMIIRVLKDLLLIYFLFLLAFCYSCQALKFSLQSRQTEFCLNHTVGDFVANPFDCKEFYWCGENGESVPASCPPNMVFNAASKLCDTTNSGQCETSSSATKPPVSQTTTRPFTTDSSPSEANQFCLTLKTHQPDSNALVFIAHPKNCYQYYMCYHGHALLQECSANLYWNTKISTCDLPSNVNCIPPSDGSNSTQILPPIDDPAGDNGQDYVCPLYGQHIFPHMQRCDFFIYCVKGYGTLQKCPFFHYFDVESGTCQWRTRALCVKDLNLQFRKKKN